MFQFRDNYDLPDYLTEDKNKAKNYSIKLGHENLEMFDELEKYVLPHHSLINWTKEDNEVTHFVPDELMDKWNTDIRKLFFKVHKLMNSDFILCDKWLNYDNSNLSTWQEKVTYRCKIDLHKRKLLVKLNEMAHSTPIFDIAHKITNYKDAMFAIDEDFK